MTATQTRPGAGAHAEAFAAFAAARQDEPMALAARRREAIDRFAELGYPGPRDEDWKYTSLRAFTDTPFSLPPEGADTTRATPSPGALVMALSDAMRAHPDLVMPHLGGVVDWRGNALWALNDAFFADGTFVYVPAGVAVEGPILLGHAVPDVAHLWYRRNLIVLGRGASACVVESFAGDGTYATNSVTEVVLADAARLDHYKAQEESPEAYHFGCLQAVLGRDANFSTHYVGLGGKLTRNEVRVRFAAENGEATVNGVYLLDGERHADNHTVIDHAVPRCNSHELYKGVLDGRGRGVFNGKIFVREDAQKTDAKQTNQTLLLSDGATIDTKPQLEIFADDVKCTHGATVGQLDERQLFYLRARGVPLAQARALLTFAFANDVVGRIAVPALRERLEKALLASSHLPPLT